MIPCPECSEPCNGNRCSCGWSSKRIASLAGQPAQALWLTKHCATPGCNTTIRWRFDQLQGEPICQWCQQGIMAPRLRQCECCGGDNHVPGECWPWQPDTERLRRFRLPYWQERMRAKQIDPQSVIDAFDQVKASP